MAKESELSIADTLVLGGEPIAITSVVPSGSIQETPPPSLERGAPVFGGRYEVRSLLGSGGMGSVYVALDRELDELVALKLLRADIVATPALLELFRREVKTARRVTHPNVARVFDIGEHEGARFLTMELIDGPSLGRILEKEGRLSVGRVIEIAAAVCAGLTAAHAASVVHRDLKPDNVLVDRNGRIVITDFGIARPLDQTAVTMTAGVPVGTPAYMAPEQVEARRDLDGRVDIYALGAMLFELLTGHLPFMADTALAVAAMRLTRPAPDPQTLRADIPDALAAVVRRCLERDREARFATAADVAVALSTVTVPTFSRSSVPPAPAPLPATTKSVAVLPVQGASPGDRLAEGLWDDLIDSLSMTSGLRVRPRATVSRAVSPEKDSLELGRQLAVDVVLETSIRRSPSGDRITARLVSVADGFQLWARRFDSATDVFALTDAIASGVSDALTVAPARPARRAPADEEAMSKYLEAREIMRESFSERAPRAIELLAEALQRAPDDPTFLATYAVANVRAWFFGTNAGVAASEARRAAERAVELAPHLADARHALALLRMHGGDIGGAIRDLRAIVDAVDFVPALESLGSLLGELDELDDARRYFELALRIDPNSTLALHDLARIAALDGRWDIADMYLRRLAAAVPGGVEDVGARLGVRVSFWRRDGRLLAKASQDRAIGPVNAALVRNLASGDAVAIRAGFAMARQMDGSARRLALLSQLEAEAAGYVGDVPWILEALEGADAAGVIDVAWLRRCPLLDPIRSHPDYARIARAFEERAAPLVRAYRGR